MLMVWFISGYFKSDCVLSYTDKSDIVSTAWKIIYNWSVWQGGVQFLFLDLGLA